MEHIRLSVPSDIPVLRELWALAFGDSGPYVDNFFERYYRPERMFVLEVEGVVRAMTAWFDTPFVLTSDTQLPAAYLYAVATHPDFRSRGLSARLLRWADEQFRIFGYTCVTTVPAQPSLHGFFAANGFQECFTHRELNRPAQCALALPPTITTLSPEEYGDLRESLLSHIPHIRFPVDALIYQQGCCRVSGGGLYRCDTQFGPAAICAEGMEDGRLLLKELLCPNHAPEDLPTRLGFLFPNDAGLCRTPGSGVLFGMVKYLSTPPFFPKNAYLGLAFD